jgi:hypothetical protein
MTALVSVLADGVEAARRSGFTGSPETLNTSTRRMPEFNVNVERSRRIRKDIQGKSALLQCAIEVILIGIVRLDEIITIGHTLILVYQRSRGIPKSGRRPNPRLAQQPRCV